MMLTGMTRALPRTNFNSSRLVRFLADLTLIETNAPGHAFAERLGVWLDFNDAIALSSTHAKMAAGDDRKSASTPSADAARIDSHVTRVRTELVQSITRSCTPHAGQTRPRLPIPESGAPFEIATDYEPYRRFYLAHQREMEIKGRSLRELVRDVLAQSSQTLKKLATLDAALDEILSDRESKLLASIPALLEKRYLQRLRTYRETLLGTQQTIDPESWLKTGGWLAGFCQEMQIALLAEADVRMQPVVGLIEALKKENGNH
jgi:hypothetical protein